ncbi:MAG: putative Ig domain-containing protein [Clostridiales bacterium]|nr:putative Ig domain-containing protein [Clostridiales bacterium]
MQNIPQKSKQGDKIMTHTKANKSKILTLILGLATCFVLMLVIVLANPTFAAYAAGEDGTAPTIIRTGGIDVDRKNHMGTLPNALKGVEYKAKDGSNYKIEATGTEPFTFSANKSGEGYAPLPEGLSLNPTTGEIVGTPTGDAGKYNISVTVTNKYGSDNISVGMYVYGETSKPKITTTQADIAVGYVDSSYSQRIVYNSGIGEPSKASITNGNLPKGLILRQAGFGIYIEGKPTEEGTFTFTVRLQNAAGFDEETYTITIQKGYQRPKIINQDDITNKPAIKGKYFEFQFEATGTNAADNPFLFFTYLNQFEESTPNAQDEYELGNGLFLTKEGKVYGTPYSTEDISFNVGVKTKNLNGDYEETGFGTGNCYVPVYENGQITGVTISPENTSVPKGGQRQFTATVIGYGDFDKSVTWNVYYNSSDDTKISQDGVLTVGIDETSTTIGVEAKSKGGYLREIPVTIINHTHTTTLVPEKPKTCTTDGNKEHYKCNVCGDLFEDAGAVKSLTEEKVKIPAGHEYGDLVPKQEPTCKQTGMQAHYKCSVCNKYFDESKTEKTVDELTIPINPNAHDFGAWIEEVPATCVATGTKGHKDCNRCNRHFDESGNEITDLTIPTNDNHDWNAWVSNGDGTHTRTCKRDNGHKENGTCSGGTATCTSKAVCEVCRTTYGDTAPHTYGDLIPEVPATTEDFGVKEHKDCSVCGKHFDKDGNEITELKIAKIGTHNVVINGESKFYAHGESVTVTAEDKEGKEFVGWKDESGKIVSTKKEYTFEVKDEMVLTAVYQDKAPGGGTIDGEIAPAPDKKGLSGGQIAGIVIGSLAGVGIVGFAIFWFVVKKKTFAELISAIKALFNKKQ